MSRQHTDVKLLKKGLKFLAISLPLLFLSPYLITLSFLNLKTLFGYIVFGVGLLVGICAVYFFFKGINTVIESIF